MRVADIVVIGHETISLLVAALVAKRGAGKVLLLDYKKPGRYAMHTVASGLCTRAPSKAQVGRLLVWSQNLLDELNLSRIPKRGVVRLERASDAEGLWRLAVALGMSRRIRELPASEARQVLQA